MGRLPGASNARCVAPSERVCGVKTDARRARRSASSHLRGCRAHQCAPRAPSVVRNLECRVDV